jgi:hypothetical protein
LSLDKDVQVFIIGGVILIVLACIWFISGQSEQLLIIGGIILIVLALIWAMSGKKINMRSHHKIQSLALLGLTAIALIALIMGRLNNDPSTFIAVASAAVGGIAGFISHKVTSPNKTVLLPLTDQEIKVNKLLRFIVTGYSTANYNLNYSMSSTGTPALPSTATLNEISGEFNFTPGPDEVNEYNLTFTVSDGQGGTDSRSIKIIVKPE